MEQHLRGMIIAKPGRIRECVHAMLASLSGVESVELIEDPEAALKFIAKSSPNFVLFGLQLPNPQFQSFLRELKLKSPETKTLVIVDNIVQQQSAKVAGADEVLLQGATAEKFIDALSKIVPSNLLKEHLAECAEAKKSSESEEPLHLTRR
ncbi:response regulator transcription factor [Candidatus Acetothermia bacterium]|nr:response regulator transcription factor [Candidatus Acetothermia bacterium]MBI3643701.1 response regulator transcription factor [Candidatus Acetothermia bacterium]